MGADASSMADWNTTITSGTNCTLPSRKGTVFSQQHQVIGARVGTSSSCAGCFGQQELQQSVVAFALCPVAGVSRAMMQHQPVGIASRRQVVRIKIPRSIFMPPFYAGYA